MYKDGCCRSKERIRIYFKRGLYFLNLFILFLPVLYIYIYVCVCVCVCVCVYIYIYIYICFQLVAFVREHLLHKAF